MRKAVTVTLLSACLVMGSDALLPLPAEAHTVGVYYPSGYRWRTRLTVPWYFTQSSSGRDSFRARVRDGANAWNARNQPMTFAFDSTQHGYRDPRTCGLYYQDNHVDFRSLALWNEQQAAAVTWPCRRVGVLEELYTFNVVFDSGDIWWSQTGGAPANALDVWSFATHEMGHGSGWFGPHLSDSSACPGSDQVTQHTMCRAINPGTETWRTLATHDWHTFEAAY